MPRDIVALLDAPPDLTTPSLAGLSWLLRHREAWPAGFVWDYDDCTQCAMGLAIALFDGRRPNDEDNPRMFLWSHFEEVRDPSGQCEFANWADEVFYDLHESVFSHKYGAGWRQHITPEHVADAIDGYLAGAAPCS